MWDYHANQIMLENKKHDCNHNQIIEQDRRSTAPNLGIVLGKSGKKKAPQGLEHQRIQSFPNIWDHL